MIVVDANLLICSYDRDSPHHRKGRAWVEKIFSDVEPVGLPWQTVSAFLRVVTNRKLLGSRLTVEQAVQIVEEWLAQPNVRVIVSGDQHWSILKRMMVAGRASGPLVGDAERRPLNTGRARHGGPWLYEVPGTEMGKPS